MITSLHLCRDYSIIYYTENWSRESIGRCMVWVWWGYFIQNLQQREMISSREVFLGIFQLNVFHQKCFCQN